MPCHTREQPNSGAKRPTHQKIWSLQRWTNLVSHAQDPELHLQLLCWAINPASSTQHSNSNDIIHKTD